MGEKTPMKRPLPATWREWKAMRLKHLAVYPECRICGTETDVVVHHVRYRGPRGKSERPGDLVTLCANHHNDLHRVLGPTPKLDYQLSFIRETALQLLDAWTPR